MLELMVIDHKSWATMLDITFSPGKPDVLFRISYLLYLDAGGQSLFIYY